MRYLPILLDVQNKRCALIGGGEVALRKLAWLRTAGAQVCIVAPELHPDLLPLIDGKAVQHLAQPFQPDQLDGCVLVICATNDAAVNRLAAEAAHARGIPVNVVDDLEQCSAIVPAVIDLDPVSIAISSQGASPVLTRWIRARIAALLPASLGQLARFMGERRKAVQRALPQLDQRKQFWETLLDSNIVQAISEGRDQDAARLFDKQLQQARPIPTEPPCKP